MPQWPLLVWDIRSRCTGFAARITSALSQEFYRGKFCRQGGGTTESILTLLGSNVVAAPLFLKD